MFNNGQIVKQNIIKSLWWNIIRPKGAVFEEFFEEFLMYENVQWSRV